MTTSPMLQARTRATIQTRAKTMNGQVSDHGKDACEEQNGFWLHKRTLGQHAHLLLCIRYKHSNMLYERLETLLTGLHGVPATKAKRPYP